MHPACRTGNWSNAFLKGLIACGSTAFRSVVMIDRCLGQATALLRIQGKMDMQAKHLSRNWRVRALPTAV